jgi:hypothetical protein
VPSRFYNLLAIGRRVILVSEADAVSEHDVGWIVEPGRPMSWRKRVSRAAGAKTRSGPNARPKSQNDSILKSPWPTIAG